MNTNTDLEPLAATPADPVHENARICTIGGDRLNEPPANPPCLSPQQGNAIAMILRGLPLGAIAEELQIDCSTLYRWRHHDEDFKAELEHQRRKIWNETADKLRGLVVPAVAVLAEQVQSRYDRARFRAATAILRFVKVGAAVKLQDDP